MGAVELATAYIALVPSLKGASQKISEQVTPAASAAGDAGGQSMGSMMLGGLKKFALPIAGLFAAFSVKKYVSESTEAFTELAGSVKGFGRITGGTIDQYSGLRGAIQMSGVDVAGATGSLTVFSKNLGNAGADATKTAAMTAKLGVSFKDASGQIKPMSELLPGVADKFKSMPDGAEKTALAMQLFGRSGAQMLPFLNQGSAGMAQLTTKAKEMGLVLDDASMRVFSKAKSSAREYSTAVEGMKVALGQTLLPVLTAVSNVGRQIMIPVFEAITKVFVAGRGPILALAAHIQDFADRAGAAVSGLLTLFTKGDFTAGLAQALGISEDARIIGVFLSIREHVIGAFTAIKDKAGEIGPSVMPMLEKIGTTFGTILAPLAPLIPKIWELAQSFSPLGIVFSQIGPQVPGIIDSVVKIAGVLTGALGDALKVVLPAVAGLAVKLAEGFSKVATDALPGLQAGLDKLLPMITSVTDRLTSNTSIIYGAITAWAIWSAVTAAIELGGTIAGLVESIQAWGKLTATIRESAQAQWILNAAQKGMPILLLVAGLAALVAGVIWAYNNIGWFKDGVDAAFKWIQQAVAAVGDWFTGTLVPALAGAWEAIASGALWLYENAIKPAWDGIMAAAAVVADWYQQHLAPVFTAFGQLFGAIGAQMSSAWNTLWTAVGIVWAAYGQPVLDAVVAVFNVMTGNVGGSTQQAGGFWSDLWASVQLIWSVVGPILETAIAVTFQNIGATFKLIWDVISAVFTFVWNEIVTVLNMALGIIQGVIMVVTGIISGNWGMVWEGIQTIFGAIWTGIVNTLGNVLNYISSIIVAGLGFVSSIVGNVLGGIGRFFGDTWNNVSAGVQGFIGGLIGFFSELPGRIMGALAGIGGWLLDAGRSLIQGFIDGIKGMVGAIGDAVGGVLDFAKQFFPHSPAKRGPFSGSGYTSFSGKALASDFAAGIASQHDVVADAAAGIMTSARLNGTYQVQGGGVSARAGAGVTNNWTINQVDDPIGTSHAIARRQNALAV